MSCLHISNILTTIINILDKCKGHLDAKQPEMQLDMLFRINFSCFITVERNEKLMEIKNPAISDILQTF